MEKIVLLFIVCLLIGIAFTGSVSGADTGVIIKSVSNPNPIETTNQDIDVTIENNWPTDVEGYIAILLKDGDEYIRNENSGHIQNFAWFKTKFVVAEKSTFTKTVSCSFSSMEGKEGSYTMEVQFIDSTDTAWDTYTRTVEIAEEEEDVTSGTTVLICVGILLLFIVFLIIGAIYKMSSKKK